MKKYNPVIESVSPNSIAAEHGIESGDKLISVNGLPLRDMIDYQFLTADFELQLEVEKSEGSVKSISIEKEDYDDLGICFQSAVFDGIRKCCNRCIFCFVDQMIKGLRDTLYIKDDDYRLSFLYGNYITLTNLTDADFERIVQQKISPLYISVHCLDEDMRATILGRRDKRPFLGLLRELSEHGIEMHGQIVLVPEYNDGHYLKETIEGIAEIEGFSSLALVPVGLTKCKNPILRPFRTAEAEEVITVAETYQQRFLEERYSRFVFCSDEFYLLAKREIPEEDGYEGYPQIENGVGLIRLFTEDFLNSADQIRDFSKPCRVVLITSVDGHSALQEVLRHLEKIKELSVECLVVKNTFFGDTVTVTGLLTGQDIIAAINKNKRENAVYFLPDVLLKHDSETLLDDVLVTDIQKQTGCDIRVVRTDGMSLADAFFDIREELS